MRALLAGIDEAGYGPMLGPLCVGMAVFRVPMIDLQGTPAVPDLWSLLDKAICREPGRSGATDAHGRVAIADSKQLKLSNSVKATHPLVHLERGVLAFVRALSGQLPANDLDLFRALGVLDAMSDMFPASHSCYGGDAIALPLSQTTGELSISTARVAAALAPADVELRALRCRAVAEPEFNRIMKDAGNKSAVTIATLTEHLRSFWALAQEEAADTKLGVVCDRLGGRSSYAPILEAALPGSRADIVEQTDDRSRYLLHITDARGQPRRIGVAFLTEGEKGHLPVALASMAAKLVRELSMMRFNRYWSARAAEAGLSELKPTAGYVQDGRRWLADAKALLKSKDRDMIVRIG
jgi:hypothetical protein